MRDNVAIGRRSKAVGVGFEAWLEGQHIHAHRLGILAFVEKTEAHTKIIGGRLQYVGKGVADYVGTLCGNGKSLAVEAKSTGDDHLMHSVVKAKQAAHLDAVDAAGGLALLLVEFRDHGRYVRCAIPWTEVPWKVKRSAESLSALDASHWRVPVDQCYLSVYHAGGPVVGSVGAVGGQQRVFPRE